jgi:hypothetical protein
MAAALDCSSVAIEDPDLERLGHRPDGYLVVGINQAQQVIQCVVARGSAAGRRSGSAAQEVKWGRG